MYTVSIPEISREQLISRYETIKPIVTIHGIKYWLRVFSEDELSGISYIWNRNEDKRDPVDMSDIVELKQSDFECIHRYGYYGMFKPSIAEVLSQIPEHELIFVNAFEIIKYPNTAADFKRNPNAFEQGFHSSTVRLYASRKNPNVIFLD